MARYWGASVGACRSSRHPKPDRGGGTEASTQAVHELRRLEAARLDALQDALWDAAMAGDVTSASAIVRIVVARVRLNGLQSSPIRSDAAQPLRTVVMPPTS